MGNIRIARRLLIAFGTVVTLTIVLGIFSLNRYGGLRVLSENIDNRDLTALTSLESLNRNEDQLRGLRALALLAAFERSQRLSSQSPAVFRQRYVNVSQQNLRTLGELDTSAEQWAISSTTAERAAGWRRIRGHLEAARNAFATVTPEAERMFNLIEQGDLPQALAASNAAERSVGAYEAALEQARQAVRQQIQVGRATLRDAAEETRNSVLLMLVITSIVGGVLSIVIHRSIMQPITELSGVFELIGKGDLRPEVRLAGRDEITDLGNRVDRMVKGLKNVAVQTRTVAAELNAATAEILASTQEQAASTAEQAAAVQQANATMAEITQSGAQISERAKEVASSAEAASSASVRGMDAVRATGTVMESIREQAEAVASNVVTLSERTQAVGEIITSVNEIAEQSHLLAVNAAIQAAAAGEHGRSFSVVADEMKNLARQSKQATLQVRSILGEIQKGITSSVMLTEEAVKRVESGRQQAAIAEDTIRDLTENVEESTRAFQQIVAGSNQQQIGFEQVTQAFRNIGAATQQTAASTKELEKAASNLNTLALQLREAVESYKV